ncbi:MAG: sulfurtransferase-like selenium metabolism protein YedF [Pseudomonadota bacterium]
MEELDCRGLACPQPVLAVKEALEGTSSGRIKVIVDNQAARDNVTRFARSQNCVVEIETSGQDFILTVTRLGPATGPAPDVTCEVPGTQASPRVVVKVSSRFMGQGEEELGRILMTAFLKTLGQAAPKPETIIFYNGGVHLTCEGSEHLETLQALEQSGIRILSCGTCLDFYHLKERLRVGAISNMFEIIETLSGAGRIVSP